MEKRKVALVTGGGQGLGAAIVEKFASSGYDVAIHYFMSEEKAKLLAEKIEKEFSVKAMLVQADLEDTRAIELMVSNILNRFSKIDVLVNNAALEINSEIEEKDPESFAQVLRVNVIGTFFLSKLVGTAMVKQQSGKIIFVTSNNGIDQNDPITLEYDASKMALHSVVKNLAIALAPFVNVNAVAPGWIKTDKVEKMNQELQGQLEKVESKKILLSRFGTKEEVSHVIFFLASDMASYINGEIIRVDGGIRNV